MKNCESTFFQFNLSPLLSAPLLSLTRTEIIHAAIGRQEKQSIMEIGRGGDNLVPVMVYGATTGDRNLPCIEYLLETTHVSFMLTGNNEFDQL